MRIEVDAEYVDNIQAKLDFLLANYITSEDGKFTFPNGDTEDCKAQPDKFRGLLCSAEYGDIEISGKQAGVLWAISLINWHKAVNVERLKWWRNNLSYKAPEQLQGCLESMFKEFLG